MPKENRTELIAELQRIGDELIEKGYNVSVILKESSGEIHSTYVLNSSVIAEAFMATVLNKHYGNRSTVTQHPNGAQSFPDFSAEGINFEAKSSIKTKNSVRCWKASKAKLFAKSIQNGSLEYVEAIYMELLFNENGKPTSFHVGNLWDFTNGVLVSVGTKGVKDNYSFKSTANGVAPSLWVSNAEKHFRSKLPHINLDGELLRTLISQVHDGPLNEVSPSAVAGKSNGPLYLAAHKIELARKLHGDKVLLNESNLLPHGRLHGKGGLAQQIAKHCPDLSISFEEVKRQRRGGRSEAHGNFYIQTR